MRILVVNNANDRDNKDYVKPIEEIVAEEGFELDIVHYSDLASQVNTYDGVILSGSPEGNDIVDHHLPFYQWLKTYNKPVLGICAGHQIIGRLYGSKLIRGTEAEKGNLEVEVCTNDNIFNRLGIKFEVKQMHNDAITLPNEFTLLAYSRTCRNQAMKHIGGEIYGVQFHPELRNPELIKNFLDFVKNYS